MGMETLGLAGVAPLTALTDTEIVKRVRAGESALFEILMRRHNQRVYRVVRAVVKEEADVEDVMQQAYIKVWGTISYWNAYVANLELNGRGNFLDARLDNAKQYPVAAKARLGHKQSGQDMVTAHLGPLHFYQLALPVPKAKAGSFDAAAPGRGEGTFSGKATTTSS